MDISRSGRVIKKSSRFLDMANPEEEDLEMQPEDDMDSQSSEKTTSIHSHIGGRSGNQRVLSSVSGYQQHNYNHGDWSEQHCDEEINPYDDSLNYGRDSYEDSDDDDFEYVGQEPSFANVVGVSGCEQSSNSGGRGLETHPAYRVVRPGGSDRQSRKQGICYRQELNQDGEFTDCFEGDYAYPEKKHSYNSMDKFSLYRNKQGGLDDAKFDENARSLDLAQSNPFESEEPEQNKSADIQRGGKMKSSFGDIDIEALKDYRRLSGYTLFTVVNKKKYSALGGLPGLANESGNASGQGSTNQNDPKSRALHKQLQELWKTLSEKSRREWKGKARRLMKQSQQRVKKQGAEGHPGEARQKERRKIHEQLSKIQPASCDPLQLAAHFKLIGDNLCSLSRQLIDFRGPVEVEGVESVLLDSLLCSLVPLVGLTSHIPELNNPDLEEITKSSINNLAFIMPALY